MLRFRHALILVLTLLLTACLSTPDAAPSGPTPTPLPTTTAPEFPVVASAACPLARFPALRTLQPQGDLIAWSPDGAWLAYVAPAATSNWFTGSLHLAAKPDFVEPVTTASEMLVFGDLTWSPDSQNLAYVTFLQPDVYSVAVSSIAGFPARDVFNTFNPRTDAWGSSKVVRGWRSPTLLEILTSCGDDCDQMVEIDLAAGTATPVGETLRKAPDRLWPQPDERDYDPLRFPLMWQEIWPSRLSPQMKRPTWTSNGIKVAYIDRTLTAWVLLTDSKQQYMLDTPFVDVQELKWSPDGRYLALRTDDDVYIFDTECQP